MDNKQIFEMADELKAAKEHKKDLEAQVKDVNARIDELLAKEEVYSDLQKVTELTEEKAGIGAELEKLYEEWEQLG